MLGLFKSRKPIEPLDTESRKYLENNFLWLMQEFPEQKLADTRIFTPSEIDFPIVWDGSENCAFKVFEIIADRMQIPINDLKLEFYENPSAELDSGNSIMFLENDPDSQEASGFFHMKDENGLYQISIDKNNLKRPEALIATIAHELSHVKLLGENKLEENDEYLTDLATVFFGFGIFNANTSFQFFKSSDKWGYNKMGYLGQEEWAYSLALLAYFRNETSPDWSKYLAKSIKKTFEMSLNYIINNSEKLFQSEEKNVR